MTIHKEYRYDVSIELMYKNELIKIQSMNIKSLSITYNYEKYNMPILLIHLQVDMKIKNAIIDNFITKTNDFVNLSIDKYIHNDKEVDLNYNNSIKSKSNFLFKRFNYILESSANFINKEIDYQESEDHDKVEDIAIGLIDFELFKKNKLKINTVIRDSSLKSLLLYYLSRYKKILIEPFNDFKIDQFLIPPIESVTELLKYISNYYCIYTTGYILFHDFDKSYLISKSGKLTKCKGDTINTFNIEFNNNDQAIYKSSSGMYYKDDIGILTCANKSDLSIFEKSQSKELGKIGVIGSNGKYKESNIYENDNINVYKINTPNIDIVDTYKYNIILNNKIVEVSKSGLDTKEFTINKEYNIINNDTNETMRGLLVEKNDIFLNIKEEFVLTTTMRFKIIPESI